MSERPPFLRPPKPARIVSAIPEPERELILTRLVEVEKRVTARIDSVAGELSGRVLKLEEHALAERETRLAVDQLRASVERTNGLMSSQIEINRAQDLDLGSIREQLRPALVAAASAAGSAEGQLSGGAAGKRRAQFVAIVGSVITLLASAALNHCQQQIANYQSGTATAAPSK